MLAAGVIGQPEPLTTVRLETENPPDPADREGRQSRGAGHPGPQPVRGPLGRGLQGVDDDPLDLLHPDHRRPGDVDQPVKTMLDEPVAPLTHRGHRHPHPACDLRVGRPGGAFQHDAAPQRQRLGRLASARPPDELAPLVTRQRQLYRRRPSVTPHIPGACQKPEIN